LIAIKQPKEVTAAPCLLIEGRSWLLLSLTVLHEKGDLSLLLRMTILMGGGALCFG
jgi:hypothetical protein